MDTETLVADSRLDLVQQRDLLARQRIRLGFHMRDDVKVLDVRDLLSERCELVEVRGEEDRGSNLSREMSVSFILLRQLPIINEEGKDGDVLRDSPGQTESIESTRTPPQLINDDQTVPRRTLEDRSSLQHLSHERRDSLELTIARSDSAEDRVEDGDLRRGAGYERTDLGHESDHSCLSNEGPAYQRSQWGAEERGGRDERFPSHVGSSDDLKLAHVCRSS